MAKIRITETASETAPTAGQLAIYAKTNHNLYLLEPGGVERKILDDSSPGAEGYEVQQFVLTNLDIAAASVTLNQPPVFPTKTLLQVDGGGPCFYGVDFEVSGSTLSWLGLRLEALLAANDRLQVIFLT